MSGDLRETIARALYEHATRLSTHYLFGTDDVPWAGTHVKAEFYAGADAVLAVLPTYELREAVLAFEAASAPADGHPEGQAQWRALQHALLEAVDARRVAAVPVPPAACPTCGSDDEHERECHRLRLTITCSDPWHVVPPEEGP